MKHILGTQTTYSYFEMILHVGTTFKVGSSHKVCFNHLWIILLMNLHASIAFKPWSSFKGATQTTY
jgi:hypothetical protein